ncbi:MAG: Inward rectifier potassium channel Irk [Terrimonas sp.]|nr:Inward rectifier potassium channel Irk [Terrimonas sp.]
MALFRRNINLNSDNSTGFGTSSDASGSRFYRKDGTANVVKKGLTVFERYSWYHTMLSLPRWKFWLMLLLVYILINLFFAGVYLLIGVKHLDGMNARSFSDQFAEAFFFSTQTFTTVGYGRINPVGHWAGVISSLEAFVGLLSFALATGLLYGRFSRPVAFLKFSEMAIIAPYKGITALMFRMVPFKNNHLTDAEVKLTLAIKIEEEGNHVNKFYPLKVEIDKINALALNWTVVHPIDERSFLWQLSPNDLKMVDAELMIFVKAFDETFSNTVVARSSYTFNEIIFGKKFIPMYGPSENRQTTILDLDKLSETVPVELPVITPPSAV